VFPEGAEKTFRAAFLAQGAGSNLIAKSNSTPMASIRRSIPSRRLSTRPVQASVSASKLPMRSLSVSSAEVDAPSSVWPAWLDSVWLAHANVPKR
jgi:hypothetical protein